MPGARICKLMLKPDYDGFGFSMRANQTGPHQISSVEANSPAEIAGIRVDDFILKVNNILVVGERYSKTVTMLKNESERGHLKLEVIEPIQCPNHIRNSVIISDSTQPNSSDDNRDINNESSNLMDILKEANEKSASEEVEDSERRYKTDVSYNSVLLNG